MIHLYGHHMPREVFNTRVQLCMDLILDLTERLISLSIEVVLDCAFWTYADRQATRSRLTQSGATCVLYYFDVPDQVRFQRVKERNQQLPSGTFEITEEMFEAFSTQFEVPREEEQPMRIK